MIIVVRTTGVAGVNSAGMAGNAEAGTSTNEKDSNIDEVCMHVHMCMCVHMHMCMCIAQHHANWQHITRSPNRR